jgi:hypothetical protein
MIISQVKWINNKFRLATYAKLARYLNQHILVIINLQLPSSHNKHNHKSHMNISEMTLLWNDSNEQVSPISEGFAEIRINLHLARENLTTRHTHGLSDLTYSYLLLSPSEIKIAPLHSG